MAYKESEEDERDPDAQQWARVMVPRQHVQAFCDFAAFCAQHADEEDILRLIKQQFNFDPMQFAGKPTKE